MLIYISMWCFAERLPWFCLCDACCILIGYSVPMLSSLIPGSAIGSANLTIQTLSPSISKNDYHLAAISPNRMTAKSRPPAKLLYPSHFRPVAARLTTIFNGCNISNPAAPALRAHAPLPLRLGRKSVPRQQLQNACDQALATYGDSQVVDVHTKWQPDRSFA